MENNNQPPRRSQMQTWGIIFCLARAFVIIALELLILQTLMRFHAEAQEARVKMLALEQANENTLMEHMRRTVQRWDQLRLDNPTLNIKELPEPLSPETSAR